MVPETSQQSLWPLVEFRSSSFGHQIQPFFGFKVVGGPSLLETCNYTRRIAITVESFVSMKGIALISPLL